MQRIIKKIMNNKGDILLDIVLIIIGIMLLIQNGDCKKRQYQDNDEIIYDFCLKSKEAKMFKTLPIEAIQKCANLGVYDK